MTMPNWCPICKLSDPKYDWQRISGKLVYRCDCPRCGRFISALHILNNEDRKEPEPDSHLLSGIVRELTENGEEPELFGRTLGKLLKHPLMPKDFKAQAMKLLPIIKKRTTAYGKNVSLDLKYDLSLAYAKDAEEFRNLIGYLEEEGLVKTPNIINVDTYAEKQNVTLTTKGWDFSENAKNMVRYNLSTDNAALRRAITSLNKVYKSIHGEDFVKLTNENVIFLSELPDEIQSEDTLRIFVEDLYKLLYEGTGELKRVPKQWIEKFVFVKHLRKYWVHDLDHGKQEQSSSKHIIIGDVFKKFSGKSSPELLEERDYQKMAKNIIAELILALAEVKKIQS